MLVFNHFDPEPALLSKHIDCALVCTVPKTSEIRYKKLVKYPFVIAIPSSWKKESYEPDDLLKNYPYVSHQQMNMRTFLNFELEAPAPRLEVDHLTGLRQSVLQGLGWTVLPGYAVEEEVKAKSLRVLDSIKLNVFEEFHLWWVPGRLDKKILNPNSRVF